MPDLVVVGAGGLGREAAALAQDVSSADGRFFLLGFLDDDPALAGCEILGLPVLGGTSWLGRHPTCWYVVGIGDPRVRRHVVETHCLCDDRAATLVHPSATVPATCQLGAGSLIFRGAILMQHVTLGRHSVVDVHGSIGHDTRVGDFLTLHPGGRLSGGVDLDSGVELGTGAIVLPGRRVGRNSIVGAGAVVTRDLPADCTAVGVPARPIGYRSSP